MNKTDIAFEIAQIESALRPLAARLQVLLAKQATAESLEYIEANRINSSNVEPSTFPDAPWFGTVWDFGDWLKTNSKKPWAEWNGRVYRTSDLILHRMPESPAVFTDVK